MRLQQANLLFAASAATTATLAAVRSINDNIGLSLNNLNADGVAVGFLPAWGEPMAPNDPSTLNRLLPRPMAVIGAYAQVQANDPNLSQVDPYVNSTLRQPGNPPLALALMPDGGLSSITQTVANRIAQKMLSINRMGIKVWLRYAHEMNGDWYAWGQQPAAFIQSWNMVTNAVRAVTNDTFMLWAPNEMYAQSNDVADPRGGYSAYWPGSNMVDIVGLSFYHYGGQDRLNNMPPSDEALKVMQRFDRLFGTPQNRPFVLAETGAAYTRLLPNGNAAPGNATESAIKVDWLHQLTGPDTLTALPSLKAITWFEVLKDENAGWGTDMKREDFRIISQQNSSLATYTLGYMNNITKSADLPVAGVAGTPSTNSSASAAASNVTTSARPSATPKSGAMSQYSSTLSLSLVSLLACSGLALLL